MDIRFKSVIAFLAVVTVVGTSACAGVPPEPTPNIEATVEARVAQERAAETPEPTPNIEATVEARLAQERASEGFKRSASWGPDDVKNSPHFDTGSIQLELECCKTENTLFGNASFGSGIVENKTNIALRNLEFTIELTGKAGLTLPDVDTEEIDLDVGEKARARFSLVGKGMGSFFPSSDVKGTGTVSVSYD
jgi:hypothetical protein